VVVADLWITSLSRQHPLTESETVRLGRALVESSGRRHVWYPGGPTAAVVIRDYTVELTAKAERVVREVLGDSECHLRDGDD
jgi:hypothetical protein